MNYIYNRDEALIREINDTAIHFEGVAIWSLGQAGVVLKGTEGGGFLCIDPYLTHSIEQEDPTTEFVREYEPPVRPEGLQGAASVLITHYHNDHLDLSTVKALKDASPNTTFAIPASHCDMVRDMQWDTDRLIPARAEESFTVGGFRVNPVAAAHTQYETDEEGNHFYLGYCITVNGVRVYHSGDTVITDELIEKVQSFKPHVMLLPINGGDFFRTQRGIIGNMSYREAADFAALVGADIVLPIHYDMFPTNRENPANFVDYAFRTYRNQKFHMLCVGERFIYMR
ncbi:MBL fold metallo-hydrolase (plasmid) [Alicyclobacillus fastidiosus]|uniref:MBL fold metallo-hydrolase n=1 Tax=Alicyclobacillus fastidiosus TaxID=392011 RepID=A0ABY6ZP61_9BACL|nr:MBL fold metallo-hydrolase [Alicyclobacillus fastidiosus]WAH44783.1 MBL fold metallo-hydrolase [Alicyclobacillus fastidiosus]GMA65738.1 MBL fold metallo-hydrolase [Alicyclobacillus fastidiosus]GMA65911.1 MBL fold metallo-hydrolase [Alicyclobacillus fastidiosus]